MKQTLKLQHKLKQTVSHASMIEDYTTTLEDLVAQVMTNLNVTYWPNQLYKHFQYPIRNKLLLIKSGITLMLVIFVFFLHSFPALSKYIFQKIFGRHVWIFFQGRLGLGWTALLGALLLFLLYDNQDLEGIFARVEWSTLLFFASLFILMEVTWLNKEMKN